MKKNKNHKAFSLVEVLIIIGIITILSTVILANLMGPKQDTKDSIVIQTMSSTPAMAFWCLSKDLSSVRLRQPTTDDGLCFYNPGGESFVAVSGMPDWPDLGNTGWDYSVGKFWWCPVGSNLSVSPAACGTSSADIWLAYTGNNPATNSCGGDRDSKQFCYMLCDKDCRSASPAPDKIIWCTENGCNKKGF